MTHVTVDAETLAKLSGLTRPLEFRDEKGNVLGRFQPDEKSPVIREWLRNLDIGISAEEIELRAKQAHEDGLTTEQILDQLRDRPQ